MKSLKHAKRLINNLKADSKIIEIAGPTIGGYQFLIKNNIKLPKEPLITNIINPVLFHGLHPYPKKIKIDKITDVRSLNFKNVDMYLCNNLTYFKENPSENKYKLLDKLIAKFHYLINFSNSRTNLHISMFRETYKTLNKNGLLLVEGIRPEDYKIAKKIKYELIFKDKHFALFKKNNL